MRHEQTIVYQKCLALMETAPQAIEQLPSGFAFLADSASEAPERLKTPLRA